MKPLTVLVTGVGGGGHGEQILKALRLADTPYRVIGADMSPMSKGLFEVDEAEQLPPAASDDYVESLLRVCRRHGISAIFHGSEPELRVMGAARERIRGEGYFLPINPPDVLDVCLDKLRTCEWLAAHGVTAPAFWSVCAPDDLDAVDRLPVVVKPSRGGGGSANVFLAQTREELRVFGSYVLSLASECLVQEYVGTPQDEFTVGVLMDMDGMLLNSIAVRRNILSSLSNRVKVPNRTSRRELGPVLALSNGISQGEIGPFPQVTEPCERLAEALGACGPINIQCRFVQGRVYVFEINPRFSGTTSLRAMVGYNEPDILIRRHVLGERVAARFPYRSGVILRGLHELFVERSEAAAAGAWKGRGVDE